MPWGYFSVFLALRMSVPTKYGDVGKSVSDLLSKDIPVNSVKVEANTQTVSGVVRGDAARARSRAPGC